MTHFIGKVQFVLHHQLTDAFAFINFIKEINSSIMMSQSENEIRSERHKINE